MRLLLALAVGCKPRPPTTLTDPTTQPSTPTGLTADTSSGQPPPLLGSECDPEIVAPTTGRAAIVVPDPHQNVFGDEPAPTVIRYSWPGNDPSTSASFLWRTDVETLATVLEYGTGGEFIRVESGASFVFDEEYRIHEVKLCEALEPGTTYRYRVGGDGHFSEPLSFTTPGAPGTFDAFRIAIAGDSRGSYEQWAQIFGAMESHDPDFFVFTGDAVASGGNQTEWDSWFAATGDVLAHKAMILAHGNHEALSANYFAQMSLPGNEQWFTIRYGTLHLVVLNDTSSSTVAWGEQATYLDRSFAEALPGAHTAAAHHQGMYATCTLHRSNEALRGVWAPKYDAWDVDLVFNGHNHLYERSVPIRDGVEVAPTEGTIYLTTGGAGAPLYRNFDDTEWFAEVANPIEHYLIADFSPAGVRVVARDLAGNVLDDFTR